MASGLPGQDPAWQGPPPIRIEGEQTVLREKRLEDAEDDYAWRSDPELATFDAVPALRMNWPDFLRVYKDELRHPPPRQRNLSIEDRAGVHIGNCMYYNLDETAGHAELGIMVGRRDYWGQGYGSEAVAAMVQHIFQTTTIRRVYLHTLTWNVRAHKAFQKAGFTPHWREVTQRLQLHADGGLPGGDLCPGYRPRLFILPDAS